jgi:hypothetical protein
VDNPCHETYLISPSLFYIMNAYFTGLIGPPPPSTAAPVPEVDLSHLSAEERAMIESVMAKAQQLDQGPPAPIPSPGQQQGQMTPQQRMIR